MSVDNVYEVVAVRYGELATTRADAFLNYADYREADGALRMGYYFWVLRSPLRTVVFDTGFSAAVGVRRGRRVLVDPREAIPALGVEDVPETVVVLSHAHYDHIGNVGHFRHARFVMAAAEYEFWVQRPRAQHLTRQLVEREELQHLASLHATGRLELISGTTEVAPGVTAIPAPGHTPGELMLKVTTEGSALLLAADAVHLDEELDRRMPFRHMCDLVAAADTYEAISRLHDTGDVYDVIPGHEWALPHGAEPDPRLPQHAFILV